MENKKYFFLALSYSAQPYIAVHYSKVGKKYTYPFTATTLFIYIYIYILVLKIAF